MWRGAAWLSAGRAVLCREGALWPLMPEGLLQLLLLPGQSGVGLKASLRATGVGRLMGVTLLTGARTVLPWACCPTGKMPQRKCHLQR
jgi:hypothetical protein